MIFSVKPSFAKPFLALAILFAGVVLSYSLPVADRVARVQSNFPAQVCPVISTAGVTIALLPSTKISARSIDGKSTSFKNLSPSEITLRAFSLLVDGNPGVALSYSALPTSGIAAVPCSSGNPDQWFIGGSGGVTSKGVLELVNSGLSESLVDIYPFTSKGALAALPVKVKANSSATVSLDALAPGEDSMALHVVTRTGRTATFLLDQRAKGLSALGMDYVKPSDGPQTKVVISGLYPHSGPKSTIAHFIRLLAPGPLDATVRIRVISGDGSFLPVGFDGFILKHGSVVTVPLANLTTTSTFGLEIESDRPILAGALTMVGMNEFAWAAPVSALTNTSMNFGGYIPTLTFLGQSIRVELRGQYLTGKSFTKTITGSDIAFWRPKVGVKTVHFLLASNSGIYVGGLFNAGGFTYFPIASGVAFENTAPPFSDVHTLTH